MAGQAAFYGGHVALIITFNDVYVFHFVRVRFLNVSSDG
jgi:hypothetical protein